jgi:hypothetical protein
VVEKFCYCHPERGVGSAFFEIQQKRGLFVASRVWNRHQHEFFGKPIELRLSERDENDLGLRSHNRSSYWSRRRPRHAHRGESAFLRDARAGLHSEFAGWQTA